MFAANHHPAMKYITPVRKTIPHRTIMNIVGPLSNPAGVEKQVIGVFDKSYINRIAAALDMLDTKRAMILSSNDGMDEISVSDITYATLLINGKITDIEINPEHYGIPLASKDDIMGEGPEFNAKLTSDILSKKIVELGGKFLLDITKKRNYKVEDVTYFLPHLSSMFFAQKIEKVKELLVYDELSLSEIAYQLNYSSVAYLSNQFKKVTGLTPSHFKQIKTEKRHPLDKV